jgi:hypothetical protein
MFLRQFETTATTILRVSPEDEEVARGVVYQYADKNFSLTDATSFTLMESHRIGAHLRPQLRAIWLSSAGDERDQAGTGSKRPLVAERWAASMAAWTRRPSWKVGNPPASSPRMRASMRSARMMNPWKVRGGHGQRSGRAGVLGAEHLGVILEDQGAGRAVDLDPLLRRPRHRAQVQRALHAAGEAEGEADSVVGAHVGWQVRGARLDAQDGGVESRADGREVAEPDA